MSGETPHKLFHLRSSCVGANTAIFLVLEASAIYREFEELTTVGFPSRTFSHFFFFFFFRTGVLYVI